MKFPLVLAAAIGSMALIGVTAVGVTYLALHPARPAPRPVAQAAPPPQLSAPPALEEPPPRPERPKPIRVRSHHRICPVPAVYHTHRPRRAPLRVATVQPVYTQARPVYAPPPAFVGGYSHPYWRAEWRGSGWRGPGWRGPGWRGPGWRYPPRWAYAPRPGYGPGWRDW